VLLPLLLLRLLLVLELLLLLLLLLLVLVLVLVLVLGLGKGRNKTRESVNIVDCLLVARCHFHQAGQDAALQRSQPSCLSLALALALSLSLSLSLEKSEGQKAAAAINRAIKLSREGCTLQDERQGQQREGARLVADKC